MQSLFHLAFHVTDLDQSRAFYGGLLGCQEGRSTDSWVDFDFFGHQISMHLGQPFDAPADGRVDGIDVPIPHLGVILPLAEWQALAERLSDAGVDFILPPTRRFEGEAGEQCTMFFRDPSGNPVEIKGFADFGEVFRS